MPGRYRSTYGGAAIKSPTQLGLDPSAKGIRLDFSRYEFKYVLPASLRTEIEAELCSFLEFDPFVVDRPDNNYLVRSLYFDDPGNTAFYEKIDGLHTRLKFRIRTYTNQSGLDVPQFLEEKGRTNNRVFKHRTPLAPLHISAKDTAGIVEQMLKRADDDELIHRFAFEYFRRQIRPVALVDYVRRPYISTYDPDFRVTFDDSLKGTETRELFPPASARSLTVATGFTIMEVKFGHHLPAWFHRIIQSYELRRVSISKICECMSQLGLAKDLQ